MTAPICRCHSATPPTGRRVKCRICGRVVGESRHKCHAEECNVDVPPRMLMCLRHWRMVPRKLQVAVWAAYVPGQEIRKDPTAEYLDAQRAAVRAVAEKERVARIVATTRGQQ